MNLPTKELIRKLAFSDQPPCLSLYMPTRKNHPDNLQESIRYKSLLKRLELGLQKSYPDADHDQLLSPLKALEKNMDFWGHNDFGLGILRNRDIFEIIRLPETVDEMFVVAESFHLKPLRPYVYTVEKFHVLGLTIQDFVMYEGNRFSLEKIELPDDVHKTLNDALGNDLTQSYTRSEVSRSAGESVNMVHGYGSKKEEVDKDIEKFFRYVATTVYERFSKPTNQPLILAALTEHHRLFQKVGKNPYLLPNGIEANPKALTSEQLEKLSWEVLEPYFLKNIEKIVDRFGVAKSKGMGSDIVEQVAKAAIDGRVDTLLIEDKRLVPGKIVSVNEIISVSSQEFGSAGADDLLDDVGEWVTKTGGEVLVLPAEKMPSVTGIAAVFRY